MKTNISIPKVMLCLSVLFLLAMAGLTANAQNSAGPIITVDIGVQKAADLYENKDYVRAKSLLKEIILESATNGDAHYALAIVLLAENSLNEAIAEAKKAIELNTDNAEYHYTLARLYGVQISEVDIFKKLSVARNIKEELIVTLKLDPKHKDAMVLLGSFYYQVPGIAGGDTDKAFEMANNLLKLDERLGRILMIDIYNSIKKYNMAIGEADKLIKVDEYTGRYKLVQILKRQDNRSRAEDEYKVIESKFGNNADHASFFNDYGYFLLAQNRTDEAVEKFKKQVALAPKSANAHDSLGEGYFKKGMLKESLAEYKKALELNPGSTNAKGKVEEINRMMNN